MSIRTFHIVFVTISTLLFAFLAVWGFALASDHTAFEKGVGILGCIGAVVMPVYGVLFYKKVRKIIL